MLFRRGKNRPRPESATEDLKCSIGCAKGSNAELNIEAPPSYSADEVIAARPFGTDKATSLENAEGYMTDDDYDVEDPDTEYFAEPISPATSDAALIPAPGPPPQAKIKPDRSLLARDRVPYDKLPRRVVVQYDFKTPGQDIVTSSSLSRLRELDAMYPEEAPENASFKAPNSSYLFTLRRPLPNTDSHKGILRAPSTFRYYKRLSFGFQPKNKVAGTEMLHVEESSFRLFERVARGSGQVIRRSLKGFNILPNQTKKEALEEWMTDQRTREVIHPCFETMRDAAECMVDILQAAVDGYDKGHQMALLVLLEQPTILSNMDPNYLHSLELLDRWTRSKYKDKPYSW